MHEQLISAVTGRILRANNYGSESEGGADALGAEDCVSFALAALVPIVEDGPLAEVRDDDECGISRAQENADK